MTLLSNPPISDSLASLNRLAGFLGYPRPIRFLINASPVDLNIQCSGTISPNTYLSGHISIGLEANIERDVLLRGDISVGPHAMVGRWSELHGDVDIGRYSRLNGANYARHDVSIGQFCAIAPEVTFQAGDHSMEHWALQTRFQTELLGETAPLQREEIKVGSDVWIGRDAILLSGATVGHGACVGAKSVVTDEVEPFEIVAGSPATHIGYRFDKATRERLLDLSWWNWELSEIRDRVKEIKAVVRAEEDKA